MTEERLFTSSYLMICGKDIDVEMINRELKILPTSIKREGEIVKPEKTYLL